MFVKVELKLQFGFSFEIFLLEFCDEVVFELDLLEALVVSGVRCCGLVSVILLVFFKLYILLLELLHGKCVRLLLEPDLR